MGRARVVAFSGGRNSIKMSKKQTCGAFLVKHHQRSRMTHQGHELVSRFNPYSEKRLSWKAGDFLISFRNASDMEKKSMLIIIYTHNNTDALILNVVIFMHTLHKRQMAASSSFMNIYTSIECRLHISKVSHFFALAPWILLLLCSKVSSSVMIVRYGSVCTVWGRGLCKHNHSLRITFSASTTLSFGWVYVNLHPSYTTHYYYYYLSFLFVLFLLK